MMHPQRVVSLSEMLLTYAKAYYVIAASIENERMQLNAFSTANPGDVIDCSDPVAQSVYKTIMHVKGEASSVDSLRRLIPSILRLENCFIEPETKQPRVGNLLVSILIRDLYHLQNSFIDELGEHFYYQVSHGLVQYYAHPMPFGEAVFDYFPKAIPDIERAGQCLALGQGTACLFHLMRVMEDGLKVLAKPLGISYAPSWESYLRQITKIIEDPYKMHSPATRKRLPFYKEVSGDLVAVKFAWRNPTMHIVRHYSVSEAEEVYRAVRSFMQRIAGERRAAPSRRVEFTLIPEPGPQG